MRRWIERKTGIFWGVAKIVNPNHRIYFRIGWGGDWVPFEVGFLWYFFYLGKH